MRKSVRWRFSLPAAVWLTLWLYYDQNGDAVYSICAAAFHECGHLLLLFALRDMPQALRFGVFGVRIERAQTTRLSYPQELAVYAAGPAANLLLAAGLLPFCGELPRLVRAVRVNLLLAGFNLLPLPPLDGGGILYTALCLRLTPSAAAAWQKKIAACGAIPLAAILFFGLLRGDQSSSSSLLVLVVVVLVAVVLPATSM
jgi:stage IV sporulation protein FB